MPRFASPLTVGEYHLEVLDAQQYDGLGGKISSARPVLKIDTSFSLPRPSRDGEQSRAPNPKGTVAAPARSTRELHTRSASHPKPSSRSAHPDLAPPACPTRHRKAPQSQHTLPTTPSTESIAHSTHSDLREEQLRRSQTPIRSHLPEILVSAESPTDADVEIEGTEVRLFSRVYPNEIRITEVEEKDGYKAIKTIIRPTSSSTSYASTAASAVVSRPSGKAKAGSHASRNPTSPKSPMGKLFSSRPTTPTGTREPSFGNSAQATPMPILTPTTAKVMPSSSSSSAWRMPSLGLNARKHIRRRSSQCFEEEVDYMQAKLAKEAQEGPCAIMVGVQVEHSVIVEPPRPRRRHRHRGRHDRQRGAYYAH